MFAGIAADRPWPATGLTTAGWLRIRPQEIEIGLLWASQPGILLEPLLTRSPSSVSGDPIPHVVAWRGKLYCEDGHHRLVRAAINGQQRVLVRVFAAVDAAVPHSEAVD